MSAVKLNFEWSPESAEAYCQSAHALTSEQKQQGGIPLVRKITPAVNTLRCPHCASIVYSRRSKICGVCSGDLPPEFQFSARESARLEKMLNDERSRHRRWMSRVFEPPMASAYFE